MKSQKTSREGQVRVEQLLSAVQTALAKAQDSLAYEKMPLLESVTLNLKAEADQKGGGKIDLWIVSLGGKRSAGHSHRKSRSH